MSSFLHFSNYVKENAEPIAIEVVEGVIDRLQLDIPKVEEEQGVVVFTKLLIFLGESLIEEEKEKVHSELLDWSKKNSEKQLAMGRDITEIIVRYMPTRELFNEILTKISIKFGLSVKENAYILKRINEMLDISLNETSLSFKSLSDKHKEEMQKELLELSVPIVPFQDNIAILPLVGDMDMVKTKHVMDNVVPKLAVMELDYVIVDFSGIFTIDTSVAEALHQIGTMLRLMGIHVISTGLRPELIQIVIKSNIDMSKVRTFATVKQAIQNIQ